MAAKGGISSLSEGRSDLLKIDPRKLHIKDGWNLRDMNAPDTVEHIDNLAKSIAQIGVQVPLRAYYEDGKAYVTSGHCRLTAALRAIEVYNAVDLKTVPVQIEERYSNDADRILGQIIHNQGKPFSQLEQAKVFKRLLDLGWQQTDIAKKTGYTDGRISQILEYLTMPQGVQGMVSKGEVAATTAMAVVKEQGGSAAEKALKEGLQKAKKDGKTKVTASRLNGSGEPRVNLKKLIRDILKTADINDSADIVTIRIPEDEWSQIIEAVGFNE